MESGGEKRPVNPKPQVNFLSSLTFWWMIPIFKKGYKSELRESDLFTPSESQRSNNKGDLLETAWRRENIKAKEKGRDPSLTRVLIWTFGPSILGYGLRFGFVEMFIKMFQPIALGKLVLYYSNTEEEDAKLYVIFYSSLIVLCSIVSTFIHHPTLLATLNKSLKIKVALASLIYRKSLRLSKSAVQNVTVGHMVNLVSSDLNNLDLICFFCHHLWIGPMVTVFATVIMYYEIGPSAFPGVIMILFTIVFQSWLIKFFAKLKKKGATKTDERLELMNEIIKGIQVIKMYVWEKPFTQIISLIRRNEIRLIKYALYIKGLHVAFTIFRTRSAIFISILTFVFTGNILTAKNVFVITACFNVMRSTMTDNFTFSIEQAKVAKVSIKRIEKFLLQEEVMKLSKYTDEDMKELAVSNMKDKSKDTQIVLKDVYASWHSEHSKFNLQNINIEINSEGYFALIGAVGSGKSTVLNLILHELNPTQGSVSIKGTVSYFSQEPWLFSSTVRNNILFGNVFNEERYKEIVKICCLEEDFNSFRYGDLTVIGDRGATLSGGQKIRIHLARAIYKEADIYLLDDPFSGLDLNVANKIFFSCINSYLKDKICVLITHQHQYLEHAKEIFLLEKGEIKCNGSYQNIQTELSNFINLSSTISEVTDSKEITEVEVKNVKQYEKYAQGEQRKKGRVKWETYKAYFEACGSCCYAFFVFSLFVLAQFFASAGDYFLKYWVNLEQTRHHIHNSTILQSSNSWQYLREFCIYSYSGITVATIIVTLLSCFFFYRTSTAASRKLHDSMLERIMQATMHFFNVNSSGMILNRFSKDVEVADVVMPYALINCMQIILSIFGVIILVSLVNPWLLVPTVLAFFVLNYLRTVYLTVSSNLKRLENETRSPLLSHLSASAQGLSTIRAFKSQTRLQMEFDATQNVHTTARFLTVAANRMFAMWLEVVCATYLALVIFSFLVFGNEYGGNVGLAITQVMGMMGSIQWGIRQSSELENHMVSVERIIEYRDLQDIEPKKKPLDKLTTWPEEGNIEFKDVSLYYDDAEQPVLKNISFSVKAKQKIGIIGRTGSGKSSIINAIFQLSKSSGEISIDGVNIEDLNLQQLRSKISIIPQEPVLFSGTLRKNLDPFDDYEDFELFKVLKDINFYEKNDLPDGLETQITENGSNFSVGQKQLICLVRAIIRNNKILILDEATANIDPETEQIIQNIVKVKFTDHTVLTIAHRLDTIVDSDKILVMEDGFIKEFDQPSVLLQNNESYLKKILHETGKSIESKFTK